MAAHYEGLVRMSVQVYRIEGTYSRLNRQFRFSQEIRAVTEDDAREQLYSLLGSCHRVKRKAVVIEQIEIIPPQNAANTLIRKLSGID
jgi:large subunit ribosomal protein LX